MYKIVFVLTSCKNVGPANMIYNIVSHIDRNVFEPILVTIYSETNESRLQDFLSLGIQHYFCALDKMKIMLGHLSPLARLLNELDPDVIHSTGVFPDFAVSRVMPEKQMMTLHNYMYDDYISEFGTFLGYCLIKLQLYAVRHAKKVVACSESLSNIYVEKLGLVVPYIRNGIDTLTYSPVGKAEKVSLREKLKLPKDRIIFVYAAGFIQRKNQRFLLEAFKNGATMQNTYLLLLSNGPKFAELKEQYGKLENVCFCGRVDSVVEYLQASDVYISSSKSEGMPASVLEGMSVGLPVILSDIEQHKEILEIEPRVGAVYRRDDEEDCIAKINEIVHDDLDLKGVIAAECARTNFSLERMSKEYQGIYTCIAERIVNPERGGGNSYSEVISLVTYAVEGPAA